MSAIRFSSRPIAVEFFAGAGGMSLGLEQAGFDVVLSVDRDGYHAATHHRNFPLGLSVCESVANLTGDAVRALLGTDREIDLVAGGPPCQGFSHMGMRDESDPRNSLVGEFIRLVLEIQPKAVLMENVPGMQSGKTAAIFEDAISRLEAGYLITREVRTLNASSFGVPQSRERLFVMAIRRDLGTNALYPAPRNFKSVTVDDALQDLPRLSDHPEMLDQNSVAYDSNRAPSSYARILRGLEEDASDFSYRRRWDSKVCTGVSVVRHRPEVVALYAATRPGEMVPGHKLPKLSPSGLAPTLRAGSESEHGSYTAPRPIHPYEPRCITAREAARLHGYPDWFGFYPGKWHAYRQIGNSVCPPVARALGSCLLVALGIRPEKPDIFIDLENEFKLPENRPTQQRRITQTEEWPKIIDYLLDRAHDKKGQLTRPTFSVSDVERAYIETRAHMPRNPARRFLVDLARSRNLKDILKPAIARRLTVMCVGDDVEYGKFVPLGTPGAIDEKGSISISSRDIANAVVVKAKISADDTDANLARLLLLPQVRRNIFREARVKLSGARNLLGSLNGKSLRFNLTSSGGQKREGTITVVRSRQFPSLAQIQSLLKREKSSRSVLIAPITREHVAITLVELSSGQAVLRRRLILNLSGNSETQRLRTARSA